MASKACEIEWNAVRIVCRVCEDCDAGSENISLRIAVVSVAVRGRRRSTQRRRQHNGTDASHNRAELLGVVRLQQPPRG